MPAAKQIDMGVPQGSVIAPLLLDIMAHDVESCVQGKVLLTMYADDLAIWLDTHIRRPYKDNNRNMKISMKTFHEAVDGVIPFMQVNGFTYIYPENSRSALPYQLTTHPKYIGKGQR